MTAKRTLSATLLAMLLATLLATLCFAAPAQAGTIRVGEKTLHFTMPAGYSFASGACYDELKHGIDLGNEANGNLMTLHAVLTNMPCRNNDPNDLSFTDGMIVITSEKPLENQRLTQKDFEEDKAATRANIAAMPLEEGEVKGETLETDKSIAFVISPDFRNPTLDKSKAQALTLIRLFTCEKYVSMSMYKNVRDDADVERFKQRIAQLIAELNFTEEPAKAK